MSAPTLTEQIETVQEMSDMLVRSYTDQIGPTKGQITEPGVARQVECLRATRLVLMNRKAHRK